jgi:hypothetical protein
MKGLLRMLEGGDRRSVGRVDEVVAAVRRDLGRFAELFEGMLVDDEVVRMRAADAAEKLTVENPELLAPFKARLLGEVAHIDQQEVRWHLAQMIPRLELNSRQRTKAIRVVTSWLGDRSNIVKTFSMQALADLAADDAKLRARVVATMVRMTAEGSPAVKSRGRKLLAKLQQSTATAGSGTRSPCPTARLLPSGTAAPARRLRDGGPGPGTRRKARRHLPERRKARRDRYVSRPSRAVAKLSTRKKPNMSVRVVRMGPDASAGSCLMPLSARGMRPPSTTARRVLSIRAPPTTRPR